MAELSPQRRAYTVAGIVAVGIALRLVFYGGFLLSDDAAYVERALGLAYGELTPPSAHFEARLGLVGPTALIFAFVGASQRTLAAFPFLCSVASLFLAYRFGRDFAGERVGLTALAFAAVFPMELIFASHLFATSPLALLTALALFLFLRAELGRARSAARCYLLAGLTLGLAFVVHETALLCLVFYPAYALLVRRPSWGNLWIAAGLVVGIAVDPLLHGLLMGAPLARLGAMVNADTVVGVASDVKDAGLTLEWIVHPWLRVLIEQEFGLFFYFVLPVSLVALASRRAAPFERALGLWVLVIFLWLSYGSLSLTTYAPLARLPRYLAPVVIPSVVLLAAALEHVSARARAVVIILVCLSSVASAALDDGHNTMEPYVAIAERLRERGPVRLVVEPGTTALGERATVLALRLAVGGNPPPDVARVTLRADREVWKEPVGSFLVTRDAVTRAAALSTAELRHLGTYEWPNSVYRRLLRQPWVLRILALGRSEYRMAGLAELGGRPSLDLFEVR